MPAFASEEGTHASRPGQQAAIFPALRLPRQPGSRFPNLPGFAPRSRLERDV
jgi:hypothetical protein